MSLPRIAVDAMGGDEGVRVMIEGAALARRRHDRFKFLLVGDEDADQARARCPSEPARASEILHAADVVSGEEKPTQALRRRQDHVDGPRDQRREGGRCRCGRLCGNTGALMAIAKLALRTMPGIDRPALGGPAADAGRQ
jgi:glycerol-3-phosphate acyltransferase PlsX